MFIDLKCDIYSNYFYKKNKTVIKIFLFDLNIF